MTTEDVESNGSFSNELAELIERHSDVPNGSRCVLLMTAFAALVAGEKGSVPNIKEFVECLHYVTGRLVKMGMVAQ